MRQDSLSTIIAQDRLQLERLIGAALLDDVVCHRLIDERDETLFEEYALSIITQAWLSAIQFCSLTDLARAVVSLERGLLNSVKKTHNPKCGMVQIEGRHLGCETKTTPAGIFFADDEFKELLTETIDRELKFINDQLALYDKYRTLSCEALRTLLTARGVPTSLDTQAHSELIHLGVLTHFAFGHPEKVNAIVCHWTQSQSQTPFLSPDLPMV